MDETNPYASPQCSEPDSSDAYSARVVAWRDGDVLVVPRRKAVLPRVCLISGRSHGKGGHGIAKFCSPVKFLLLPLLLVPFVGFYLALIAGCVSVTIGWGANCKVWLSYRFVAGFAFCEVTSVPFAIAGNLLTGTFLFTGESSHLISGIACLAIFLVLYIVPLNVLAPFRVAYSGGPYARIRGVHPDCLKGLPEFSSRESSDLVPMETAKDG
jgi:hypothetical protein